MLHFLMEIIIMTRSTKTRLLLRDKCKVVHSDRLYRPTPARPLRSALTTSLVPKRNKTVRYGRRMIDTSSATLWNSLSNNIKCARNVLHFKRLAKLHLASS